MAVWEAGAPDYGAGAVLAYMQGERRDEKADIVERVAGEADIIGQVARAVVDAVPLAMGEALARGKDVVVTGFGRFSRKNRSVREDRNLRTGEPVAIPASTTASFRASKALKEVLN